MEKRMNEIIEELDRYGGQGSHGHGHNNKIRGNGNARGVGETRLDDSGSDIIKTTQKISPFPTIAEL
jgi:hypothetical protein